MADGIMTSLPFVCGHEMRYFYWRLYYSWSYGGGGGKGRIHPLHHPVSKWQCIVTDVLDGLHDPLSYTLLEELNILVGPVLIKREWICYMIVSLFSKLLRPGREEGWVRSACAVFERS